MRLVYVGCLFKERLNCFASLAACLLEAFSRAVLTSATLAPVPRQGRVKRDVPLEHAYGLKI